MLTSVSPINAPLHARVHSHYAPLHARVHSHYPPMHPCMLGSTAITHPCMLGSARSRCPPMHSCMLGSAHSRCPPMHPSMLGSACNHCPLHTNITYRLQCTPSPRCCIPTPFSLKCGNSQKKNQFSLAGFFARL